MKKVMLWLLNLKLLIKLLKHMNTTKRAFLRAFSREKSTIVFITVMFAVGLFFMALGWVDLKTNAPIDDKAGMWIPIGGVIIIICILAYIWSAIKIFNRSHRYLSRK